KPRRPRAESEALVRSYLKHHKARAAKGEVSIREVHQETGVSIGSIQGTAAWKALQSKLEKLGRSRCPQRRKAQAYTNEMDGVAGDTALQELIREQEKDSEPSPLDKGRRGKVRIKKKL